jgi:hypothetical protein
MRCQSGLRRSHNRQLQVRLPDPLLERWSSAESCTTPSWRSEVGQACRCDRPEDGSRIAVNESQRDQSSQPADHQIGERHNREYHGAGNQHRALRNCNTRASPRRRAGRAVAARSFLDPSQPRPYPSSPLCTHSCRSRRSSRNRRRALNVPGPCQCLIQRLEQWDTSVQQRVILSMSQPQPLD